MPDLCHFLGKWVQMRVFAPLSDSFSTEVCFEANILNMFSWEIVFVKVKDPRYQYVSMLQYAIDTDMLPRV
jgi:hypothetical protein